MIISERDKRALLILGGAVVVWLLYALISPSVNSDSSQASSGNIALAEMKVRKLRILAANLPSREQFYKQAKTDLDLREKSVINANDEKLAQERLLDIVEKLARQQAPPLDIRSKELQQPKIYGDYGQVSATLSLTCRIEQLVNFLSDLTAQPEAISSEELHVYAVNPESKEMQVRLTVGGLVPQRLLPKKKEMSEF